VSGALVRTLRILSYEWRRAIARRKVLLLVIITVLFEVAPFVILTQLQNATIQSLVRQFADVFWLIGVLAPQGLFLHLTAVLIASSATAEEHEHGTLDILLTQPVTRLEYLVGKYFGGFTLMMAISTLLTVLGVTLATVSFGPQRFLEHAPALQVASLYTLLLFYSLGFMFGEVYRRASFALLSGISVFISSLVLGGILYAVNLLTGDPFYLVVDKALPAWSATSLPQMVAEALFLGDIRGIPFLSLGPPIDGTILEALLIILAYSVASVAIVVARFRWTDIGRRAT